MLCLRLQARALSTSTAARADLVSPGIQLYGLEGRYAHALFSAASKTNTLGKVESELATVKSMAQKDQVFQGFLSSPVLNSEERTGKTPPHVVSTRVHSAHGNACYYIVGRSKSGGAEDLCAILDF